MNAVIAITGTPGTGKSALGRELSLLTGWRLISLATFIRRHRLADGHDEQRDCLIVDPAKLAQALAPIIAKSREKGEGLIVEGHLSHSLPARLFDCCIVARCDPSALRHRLAQRKYPGAKLQENVDCEILDVCGGEARKAGHRTMLADTTFSKPRALANKIFREFLRFA